MEKFPESIPEENEDLLKRLSIIRLGAYEKAKNEGFEKHMELEKAVSKFARDLEQKYPDAHSRRLWHLLIGSTLPPGMEMGMEDYPGEDSIIQFIEGLASTES